MACYIILCSPLLIAFAAMYVNYIDKKSDNKKGVRQQKN